MADFERKSDGRRIFTTEFKRQVVERIRSGETTAAAAVAAWMLKPEPTVPVLRLSLASPVEDSDPRQDA